MKMMYELAGVPIVIGLVEVLKKTGLPNRMLPLLALILGILYSFFVFPIGTEAVLQGLVVGLAAQGLYRGTKVLVNNK